MSDPVPPANSNGNLDSFVKFARPQPEPLSTSQEIRDRGSIFVAYIYAATTPEEAKARVNHVKYVVHRSKPASHEICAWRCMAVKHGCTGLGGPDDFELKTGSMDDGESWAGGKVLKVMQQQGIIDAIVVVSRWFGGTMLGPARFTHIEICTSEVCQQFRRTEDLRESIATLGTLDDLLSDLRSESAQISATNSSAVPSSSIVPRKPDYSTLDLAKAKRLVNARQNAIRGVRALLSKRQKKDDE